MTVFARRRDLGRDLVGDRDAEVELVQVTHDEVGEESSRKRRLRDVEIPS